MARFCELLLGSELRLSPVLAAEDCRAASAQHTPVGKAEPAGFSGRGEDGWGVVGVGGPGPAPAGAAVWSAAHSELLYAYTRLRCGRLENHVAALEGPRAQQALAPREGGKQGRESSSAGEGGADCGAVEGQVRRMCCTFSGLACAQTCQRRQLCMPSSSQGKHTQHARGERWRRPRIERVVCCAVYGVASLLGHPAARVLQAASALVLLNPPKVWQR